MAAIEVKGLSYTYPGSASPALKDVHLRIEPGELVALVGANGAGKSSLCLALAGLIPQVFHGQMQGNVTVLGLDTRQHSPGEFAGKVGLALQNPDNQLSGMRYSVFEEVAFGLENLGIPRLQMPARIERALQKVGLAEMGERSPYTLSGGQRQRLALASILALQPPVLVLDEPTAMLDPQGSQEVFEIVQEYARAGGTVVIAEHRLEWAARSASRVIALAEGALILDDPPEQALASPQLVEAGIGWLRYTHAACTGRTRGLWTDGRTLPVTLEQAAAGFIQAGAARLKEPHADPG